MKMCLSKDGFVQVRQKREDSFRFGEKRNPGRISAAGNLSLGSFFTAPSFHSECDVGKTTFRWTHKQKKKGVNVGWQ